MDQSRTDPLVPPETPQPTLVPHGPAALAAAVALAAVAVGLAALSGYNYLLFHVLVELVSIAVAWSLFLLVWNARRFMRDPLLLTLGVGYLFVGLVDLVHTLAFPGMGVFPGASTNLAAQLWLAARYLEAGAFLVAPMAVALHLRARTLFAGFGLFAAGLTAAILAWDGFPDAFVPGTGPGTGLTGFKVGSEYAVCAALAAAGGLLYWRRGRLAPDVLGYLLAAIGVTIFSELSFTLYQDPYGAFNAIGHYAKIGSYYFIYRAIVVTGLARPYDVLFRELAQTEERYRGVVEGQTELICRFRPDGTLVYVNEPFARYFGRTAQELSGASVHEVVRQENGPALARHLASFTPEENVRGLEFSVRRPDGTEAWHQWSTRAFFDPEGTVTGYQAVGRDVTARRAAEQAVRESEERFRRAVDNYPCSLVIYGPDRRIRFINAYGVRISGHTEEDLLGRRDEEVNPPEVYEGYLPYLKRAVETRTTQSGEATFALPADAFTMAVTYVPLLDAWGELREVLGIAYDVTERARYELGLLREQEELSQEVRERTDDLARAGAELEVESAERMRVTRALAKRRDALEAVYGLATSRDRAIDRLGDAAVRALGRILDAPDVVVRLAREGRLVLLSRYDTAGRTHEAEVPADCGPCGVVCREGRAMRFGPELVHEFADAACVRDRGARSFVGVPMRGHEGQLLGMMCALDAREDAFDEEDAHLVEIFARYIGYEIEHAELEDDLRESARDAAVGQVVGGIAHEVRNPLNTISITSELLAEAIPQDDRSARYVDRIHRQADRLNALMQDLLELRRPVETQRFRRMCAGDVARAVAQAWEGSTGAQTHRLRVEAQPAGREAHVLVDEERMTQVFLNLLDNASQHSPDGSDILLDIDAPGDGWVAVRVVDRGEAVPADRLARVFDPFFSTRKGGSGLGLSIVRHIVERHGGRVTLSNNEPPPGTCAQVRLPRAEEGD